ncbi:MAG TPA: twin-arginine translocation signal domain-containing protein, partial [Streptomyces sp.]|nr:twin-arginine translocation signal domain-containing protein [Streptomyces sp.]
MSRIRSVAAAATNPDRRAFLAATGAVGLAAGAGFALRP